MRGIVEDVLWEGGVLTTDEIYRGVKAKHAQLGRLLPPRWQEKVEQILEAHCISHEGNSWFLENIEQLIRQILEAHRISHEGNSRFLEKLGPLEGRPECETSLFDPHGTSERIINDSNRGQKRTDWANTESYRYLDLALGNLCIEGTCGLFFGPNKESLNLSAHSSDQTFDVIAVVPAHERPR